MSRYRFSDEPKNSAYPIAKAGFPFIGAGAFATFVLAISGFSVLAFLSLLITFFVCFFFRDPDRVTPDEEGAVISPADGKVIFTDIVDENPFVTGPCMKISIFMSVFNVHINRIPFAGIVKDIQYFPGKFFNASFDKASEDNERNAIVVETEDKKTYAFVQIAGLIARRIICNLHVGDSAIRGQRFGLICFGSRLDVYLPADSKLNVSVGDKVKSGTSIIGYMK